MQPIIFSLSSDLLDSFLEVLNGGLGLSLSEHDLKSLQDGLGRMLLEHHLDGVRGGFGASERVSHGLGDGNSMVGSHGFSGGMSVGFGENLVYSPHDLSSTGHESSVGSENEMSVAVDKASF